MAHIIKTKCFVLKTTPFKESSLIVSILTNRLGKLKVLAKGARRPRSRICGAMEPFNLDEIIFYKRESKEIYSLSDAMIIDDFEEIRISPRKVNAAMVFCEFFEKTLPSEESNAEAFVLLFNFMRKLRDEDESTVRSLVFYYLFKALPGAGVRPHLEDCVLCHKHLANTDNKIDFSINAGGIVCDNHFDDTVTFLSRKTFEALLDIYKDKNFEFDNESINELVEFIPDYLYYHLNNLILNSLKHFK